MDPSTQQPPPPPPPSSLPPPPPPPSDATPPAGDQSTGANANGPAPSNQGAEKGTLQALAAVEPDKPLNQNDFNVLVPNNRMPTSSTAQSTPTVKSTDASDGTGAPAEAPSTSSIGTGALISIAVSMVVLAVLGVAMVLYVRRRRELQQLIVTRRLQARTTSNLSGNYNNAGSSTMLRNPPLRSSSLVRRNPSPLGANAHMPGHLTTIESVGTRSEMTVESSPFSVTTSQAAAEAWGIPPQVPATWPAHVPRPNGGPPLPSAPEEDTHNVSARQLEAQEQPHQEGEQQQQQQPPLMRDTSVKRSRSIHNRVDRSDTTGMQSRFSNDNDIWESNSIWSEDEPEHVRPPRKSLATFCNPISAAAAAGVLYEHASTANSSWQTQPTTSQNTTGIMDDEMQAYNDSCALSDDDGPLSDKLNELISAEQRTRNRRSPLAGGKRENTTLGSALMATLSPGAPVQSSAPTDALVLEHAPSSGSNHPELGGILDVSKDTMRDTTPQASTPPPSADPQLAGTFGDEAAEAAASSSSKPTIAMPRPQSIGSFDALKMMASVGIQDEVVEQMVEDNRQSNLTRDSIVTMATTLTDDSSRPVSDANLDGMLHAHSTRGVNTARRVNIATATVNKVDMDGSGSNSGAGGAMSPTDLQLLAQHIPLPETPQPSDPADSA
ncbi:hypothetical protein SYNPS1DRAFT_26694 [Syncephalis pseudoplumigaleata]|uniref:Uncharacterized protein n=1 Tax=Syncephalis pseudoplumigaleata TaxID=1712513 RepID=A0A4P9Z559_9FUNG|nr:hypothetical protein SYNPS1DRAFT_26694 [Syncephalis pseudoplumigaleata]|eukprot:RKP27666.1 hypothetical protein SYNPS1DRAFT_26694 [Syncephalis pseudoplumigaleata]